LISRSVWPLEAGIGRCRPASRTLPRSGSDQGGTGRTTRSRPRWGRPQGGRAGPAARHARARSGRGCARQPHVPASRRQAKQAAQAQKPALTWADAARREGFEPPTARSVGWLMLFLPVRSEGVSRQSTRVSCGDGWRTGPRDCPRTSVVVAHADDSRARLEPSRDEHESNMNKVAAARHAGTWRLVSWEHPSADGQVTLSVRWERTPSDT
jgi:hypothetical protein